MSSAPAPPPRRLVVDVREKHLIEFLEALPDPPQFHVEPLDLGDVQILRDDVPDDDDSGTAGTMRQEVIFERKTICDLCASVKDGRYAEQKQRVVGCRRPSSGDRESFKVVYIIENYTSFTDLKDAAVRAGLHPQTLQSCVHSLMFRSGIFVIFTRDISDTAAYIDSAWKRRVKLADYSAPTSSYDNSLSSALIAGSVHSKRNKNVTHATCYAMQLCQVPGVSAKTANVIASRWPSMAAFYRDMQDVSSEERMMRLSKLPAIGKKNATSILTYMFA